MKPEAIKVAFEEILIWQLILSNLQRLEKKFSVTRVEHPKRVYRSLIGYVRGNSEISKKSTGRFLAWNFMGNDFKA